jgi:hypothetical protein
MNKKNFTLQEAKDIGDILGIDFDAIDLEQFRLGLAVELEHGLSDKQTNITEDDKNITGKIALAHLKEIPDYYSRLAIMEADANS